MFLLLKKFLPILRLIQDVQYLFRQEKICIFSSELVKLVRHSGVHEKLAHVVIDFHHAINSFFVAFDAAYTPEQNYALRETLKHLLAEQIFILL